MVDFQIKIPNYITFFTGNITTYCLQASVESLAGNWNQFQFLLYQQVTPFVADHIPSSSKTSPKILNTKQRCNQFVWKSSGNQLLL